MKGLLFWLLTLLAFSAFSQKKIRKYVSSNAVTIRSISISDTNYSDLQALSNAIGNARVVMLGEQDHGDAPTFIAKARLIKYLHEKLGFNVLAFESDFYGLTAGYEEVQQGTVSVDSLLRANLFEIWTTCQQFGDMFQYIRDCAATNHPLKIAGIDNQLHGSFTKKHLKETITKIFKDASIPLYNDSNSMQRYLRLIDTLRYYTNRGSMPREEDLRWLSEQTNFALTRLRAQPATDALGLAALENVLSTCIHQQLLKTKLFGDQYAERDKQMALNLQWLLTKKYPTEKIIVWAANGHVSRNQYEVAPANFRHLSMGGYFTNELGYAGETYVLGFNSFQGTAGRTTMPNSKYQLPSREDKSFERWIDRSDREFALVDFKEFNRKNPQFNSLFVMSGSNHFQQKGAWHHAFDGVFFVKNMYSCDKTTSAY